MDTSLAISTHSNRPTMDGALILYAVFLIVLVMCVCVAMTIGIVYQANSQELCSRPGCPGTRRKRTLFCGMLPHGQDCRSCRCPVLMCHSRTVAPGAESCVAHQCIRENCLKLAVWLGPNKLCRDHGCPGKVTQNGSTAPCNSMLIPGAAACPDHTCVISGCDQVVFSGSRAGGTDTHLCKDHQLCCFEECWNTSTPGSDACLDHCESHELPPPAYSPEPSVKAGASEDARLLSGYTI
jgi:hypothetical protein